MTAAYRFGRFELNAATRQLLVEGQPAALGTRAFDVLLILIERRERLVTKDELLDLAWPGLVVEENNLQVQISALRKVIGNEAIRTVPGRGYQFTAEANPSEPSERTPVGARKSNLPRPLTRFVGHEADLDECQNVVAINRLVTLTGVGGCGKTRLAIELAARVLPMFAQGAWFVDLAPVVDAEDLPSTIARTLGLVEQPRRSIVETLCDHLAGRQILLVLDNCEHLLSACASLAQTMLRRASWLKVLATSREALGVPGEYALRVRSLSCPPAEGSGAPDQIQAFEAVQLFLDRARLIDRSFALDQTTAPAIADICRRLDGIPLAVELAVARTKTLSVDELRRKLDDRFRLLTGGSRMAPPRQQTLLATIKWSFDLLASEERALLERLSVFSGGWTLEGAVAVTVEKADQYDVLEQLSYLVDKSLIATRTDGDATRYSMLETVRQYARDRLLERGDEARCRDRHLAYFLALAEQAEPHLTGPEQNKWFDRLETEHENLRAALTWSVNSPGRTASNLRLATALVRFWRMHGHYAEGRAALAAALAVAPELEDRGIRAKAFCGAGTLAMDQADEAATYAFDQSLALCRELGDRLGIANALHGLGYVARQRGDFARHRALAEEVVAMMRAASDPQGLGKALVNLGNTISEDFGDQPAGRAHLEEALAILQESGNRDDAAWALVNLGLLTRDEGDLPRGLACMEEGLSIFVEFADRRGAVVGLRSVASVTLAMNRPGEAVRLWAASERLREEIGYVVPTNERLRGDRELSAARATLGDAAYHQAWQEGRAMTWKQAVQCALDLHIT